MSRDGAPSVGREEFVAFGAGIAVAAAVLVAIAVVVNGPRIWDTSAFCGSYADFQETPVPAVCLSFPEYLRLSLFHPPYVVPAVMLGVLAAVVSYRRERLRQLRR